MITETRIDDAGIAKAVAECLRLDVQVPDDKITAAVADGWLTLDGEVEWRFQREAAADALRNVVGVRGIVNDIKVVPKRVSAYDVSLRIRAALEDRADHTAEGIVVSTNGGVVTLTGIVPSVADRRAAESAAWAAPGVTDVGDEIEIGV